MIPYFFFGFFDGSNKDENTPLGISYSPTKSRQHYAVLTVGSRFKRSYTKPKEETINEAESEANLQPLLTTKQVIQPTFNQDAIRVNENLLISIRNAKRAMYDRLLLESEIELIRLKKKKDIAIMMLLFEFA